MREFLARLGRKSLWAGLDVLPEGLKWDLMAYAPVAYLNIVPESTEEEFRASGREHAAEIVTRLTDYEEDFAVDGATVLEIGVGPGRLLVPFGTRGADFYGIDVSRKNLAKAEAYAREYDLSPSLVRSKSSIPDFGVEFDLVLGVLAFHHMRRRTTIRYLKAARRALADSGAVYFNFANLADPSNQEEYLTEGLEKTYSFRVRYYTAAEVRLLLEGVGYSDVVVRDEGRQLVAMARP